MAFDWLNVTGIPAKGDPAAVNQDLTPMLPGTLCEQCETSNLCALKNNFSLKRRGFNFILYSDDNLILFF